MAQRSWKILAGIILILATVIVYADLSNHQFISFDDNLYVTDNPTVQRGLTLQGVTWAFTTFHAGNWIPLTWLSHMVNCQLFGLNPRGHLLTNLLLHVANTLLLFSFFLRTTQALGPSFLVAALFALHPLHVESVAWVSERKDVLSTFFWLLTMWAYVWYLKSPGIQRYLAVLLCFGLGLMSKPMLVTLPFVLLLLDYWPLGRWQLNGATGANPVANRVSRTDRKVPLSRLILEKVPLLVLVVMFGLISFHAQKVSGAVTSVENFPIAARLSNALIAYVSYMGMMIWPAHLGVYYPLIEEDITFGSALGAGLILLFLSSAIIWQARRRLYLPVGWLWYLGTLVPVIGLVQIGNQALADRYTYVPLIGLFLIIAYGLSDLVAGWPRLKTLVPLGIGILLAALALCTYRQVGYWHDSQSLYEHTLRITRNNYLINYNLGNRWYAQGKLESAISCYTEALRIFPDYFEAHNNLGLALQAQGKAEQAIFHYNEALRINPDFDKAHNNLGLALYTQGKVEPAISHYNEALRLRPHYPEAHNNLGMALYAQGKVDSAISHYNEALRLQPGFAQAHYNLGLALQAQGRTEPAISHFTEALRINPDFDKAHNQLGLALYTQGKVEQAIFHYSEVLRLQPNNFKAHNNLGIALASQGKLEQAIQHYRQALHLKPDYAQALNNLAYVLATAADQKFRDGPAAVQLAEKANRLTGFSQPETVDTLAAAYAAAGRFPEAIQSSRKALNLARRRGQPDLIKQITDRMYLYQAGLPFRASSSASHLREESR
ncbi:MAG: tetratricopeptide repeat protein [Thermodesulfobacteriota bacterium]